jgi:hypothetical protein
VTRRADDQDRRPKADGDREQHEQERQDYPWTGHIHFFPDLPGE